MPKPVTRQNQYFNKLTASSSFQEGQKKTLHLLPVASKIRRPSIHSGMFPPVKAEFQLPKTITAFAPPPHNMLDYGFYLLSHKQCTAGMYSSTTDPQKEICTFFAGKPQPPTAHPPPPSRSPAPELRSGRAPAREGRPHRGAPWRQWGCVASEIDRTHHPEN